MSQGKINKISLKLMIRYKDNKLVNQMIIHYQHFFLKKKLEV